MASILLGCADTETGGDYARQVAEAGRRDDDERADRIGDSIKWLDNPDHHDDGAGGAADGRVQREGESVDPLRVNSQNAGGAAILRGGPDRLPHSAVFHKQDHGDRQTRRHADANELGDRYVDQPVGEVKGVVFEFQRLRVRTEEQVHDLRHHDGEAERREKRGEQVALDHPGDDQPVADPAYTGHDGNRHRNADQGGRVIAQAKALQPPCPDQEPRGIAARDHEISLREIFYVHYAPDQREAVRGQREQGSDHQAVDDYLQIYERELEQ